MSLGTLPSRPANWLGALARQPAFGLAIALSLAVSTLLVLEFVGSSSFGYDFRVFRYSAQVDIADVYNHRPQSPFVYPPTAIAFFRPLGLMPISIGLAVWMAVSASIFLLATRPIDRRAIALVVISPVFLKCIFLGQSSLILSALVLLAVGQRGWFCGLLLGLVVAIKPQIVILAPLALLIRNDWRALAGMALAVGAAVALEVALYGVRPWFAWLEALPAFRQTLLQENLLWIMVTPAGVAQNLGLPSLPFLILGGLLGCAAIIVAARKVEGPEFAALLVTASVLAVPYALPHDLIALLPWAALLMLRTRISLHMLAALLVLTLHFMTLGLVIFTLLWISMALRGQDKRLSRAAI